MKIRQIIVTFVFILMLAGIQTYAQLKELENYRVIWNTQSKNSSESMPCGGGDIGLNVWVENNELLFYIARSGTFDENNALLKLGRIRVKLDPNPFSDSEFKQELMLEDGYIRINGKDGSISSEIKVWVDVFHPRVHVDINSNKPTVAEAVFESWRFEDRLMEGKANNANSYKWAPQGEVKTWKDNIQFKNNTVLFYHQNQNDKSVFDVVVKQQGMEQVKDQLFNPLQDLIFGGMLQGQNMVSSGNYSGKYCDTDYKGWGIKSKSASRTHSIEVVLHTEQTHDINVWEKHLHETVRTAHLPKAFSDTKSWWNKFWDRSYIILDPGQKKEVSPAWQAGRNFQLFRYMLGCNAYGKFPTKFNGGLFTFDPVFVDSTLHLTPDHRNWGGGTHTAMNQRLVHFPMIKSGDFDLLKPQFDFYLNLLRNVELRSETYWGHKGACFTEQIENFGLPNPAEYGWKRPDNFDKGLEYNAWLEYLWDTSLEFCLMMLEEERYTGKNISGYLPFIESCLIFFDEHYQYLARQRGRKPLDQNNHLILYPGTAGETYKMAYNSTTTISALQIVLKRLLELPETYLDPEKRLTFSKMLERIPPLPYREIEGKKVLAPALLWERVNNIETPQLYPVFPWGIYGVGKPDLEIALNTWKYDPDAIKFRDSKGWKQDNIFAARLGLTDDAFPLTVQKLKDSEKRFPAFWGPGFDWTPDHNLGGTGMLGLQEMLLQTNDRQILLFPSWPQSQNVHFKLHAPYNTTVEVLLKDSKLVYVKVFPKEREKDVVLVGGSDWVR